MVVRRNRGFDPSTEPSATNVQPSNPFWMPRVWHDRDRGCVGSVGPSNGRPNRPIFCGGGARSVCPWTDPSTLLFVPPGAIVPKLIATPYLLLQYSSSLSSRTLISHAHGMGAADPDPTLFSSHRSFFWTTTYIIIFALLFVLSITSTETNYSL